MSDSWHGGTAYERFMGRWSRLVAREFLQWLSAPPAARWVDVGCGPGTLTRLIVEEWQPTAVAAIDSSPAFVTYLQQTLSSSIVEAQTGLAQSLPLASQAFDVAVSGLVLNFVPDPETALREMARVTAPGGVIGIFLWDYADGMEMLRYFWDAAVRLDDRARELDEGVRFPLCHAAPLASLARQAGLSRVETTPIEVTTRFADFDDYWLPLLGEVGPAPAYVSGLAQAQRELLKETLRQALPIQQDGSISLLARAWAMRGVVA